MFLSNIERILRRVIYKSSILISRIFEIQASGGKNQAWASCSYSSAIWSSNPRFFEKVEADLTPKNSDWVLRHNWKFFGCVSSVRARNMNVWYAVLAMNEQNHDGHFRKIHRSDPAGRPVLKLWSATHQKYKMIGFEKSKIFRFLFSVFIANSNPEWFISCHHSVWGIKFHVYWRINTNLILRR